MLLRFCSGAISLLPVKQNKQTRGMSISAVSKLDQSPGPIKQPHHNDSPSAAHCGNQIYLCLSLEMLMCAARTVHVMSRTVEGRAPGAPQFHQGSTPSN